MRSNRCSKRARWSCEQVVEGLNRVGFRTPEGSAWTAERLATELRTLAE